MEELLNIKPEEVRLGLFRLRWAFPTNMANFQGGSCKVKTHLCGSQLNHVFNLIYSFQATINKTRKYSAILTVENTACKTDIICENDKNAESSTKQLQHQQLLVSNIKDWQVDPLYMWCSLFGWETSYCLVKKNSVNWILTFNFDSPFNGITLWIDFGTSTAAEIRILNGLNEMFNNQTNCDVHFQFKDMENIGAHANILSAGSPVFAAMFQSSFLESKSRNVVIDDIDPEVFRQLLIFLYTGKAPRLKEKTVIQPLYEVADKYGVVILKNECIKVLQTQLSTENAIDILVWSNFFSIPNLFDTAMEFFLENSRELCSQPQWMSFMKNHPELCLQANQRMAALLPPSKKRAI